MSKVAYLLQKASRNDDHILINYFNLIVRMTTDFKHLLTSLVVLMTSLTQQKKKIEEDVYGFCKTKTNKHIFIICFLR